MHLNDELNIFIKANKLDRYVFSVFIVGSEHTDTISLLSDIDIVVIGKIENRITEIRNLQLKLRNFFKKFLDDKYILFAEPSYEKLYFINNSKFDKKLVHLIYHPIDRFFEYSKTNDFVLFNWKDEYDLVFGEDLFKKIFFDDSMLNNQFLIKQIDNLIQQIQNLFLIADIDENYYYYLKTYIYCMKVFNRLNKILKQDEIQVKGIENYILNKDTIGLENRIIEFEKVLFNEKKKISLAGKNIYNV